MIVYRGGPVAFEVPAGADGAPAGSGSFRRTERGFAEQVRRRLLVVKLYDHQAYR